MRPPLEMLLVIVALATHTRGLPYGELPPQLQTREYTENSIHILLSCDLSKVYKNRFHCFIIFNYKFFMRNVKFDKQSRFCTEKNDIILTALNLIDNNLIQ